MAVRFINLIRNTSLFQILPLLLPLRQPAAKNVLSTNCNKCNRIVTHKTLIII